MKVSIDLPEIEGFEYTGEYRAPKTDEWFLDGIMTPYRHGSSGTAGSPPYPILKKKAPVYKTYHAFHSDVRFVELKALEDALNLVSFELSGTEDYKALKELIK